MKIPKLKKDQIIKAEWIDTMSDPAWLSEEDAGKRPDTNCSSVGFYLKSDREFLYMSSSIMGDKDRKRDQTAIPIGCISRITKI